MNIGDDMKKKHTTKYFKLLKFAMVQTTSRKNQYLNSMPMANPKDVKKSLFPLHDTKVLSFISIILISISNFHTKAYITVFLQKLQKKNYTFKVIVIMPERS